MRPSPKHPVVEEYARLAPEYDARWSFYVEATSRETLARLRLKPADRVLDVGCGTGALLSRLSRSHPAARLTGVDPVPEMLAVARRGLPPAVRLAAGWAERLPFASGRFDAVVSCNVFHYIRQPLTALREMNRVLRPGGQLVITDWCDDYLACRACDLYLRLFSPAHFKIYRRQECMSLLRAAGHRDVNVERYKINWLWGLMTARVTKANSSAPDSAFSPR
ncbi:MAG TPA: methyltransferase domain-containing protein [Thermoanaerobaculia bacterium]|nr:methyltransferase domain-containing protein [Thermoanaerobaculia bacterium]